MEVNINSKFERKKFTPLWIAAKLAEGIVVEKNHNDAEIKEQRRITCWNCPNMDKKNIMCNICGCFLDVKTESLINIVPGSIPPKSEITHCPENRWEDEYSKSYFNS